MVQKKLIFIFFLCIGFVLGNSRVRRHLVFTKGSKLFFSVDVRDNLYNYNDFFAHVFGVKLDWDLPYSAVKGPQKRRIQRRDLYQGMERFLHQQNLNGTSCVRKFLCEAALILPKSNLFLAQLYEIIFSVTDEENGSAYSIKDIKSECTEMLTSDYCPVSLMTIFHGVKSEFKILIN